MCGVSYPTKLVRVGVMKSMVMLVSHARRRSN
jgi:hypothetical protein